MYIFERHTGATEIVPAVYAAQEIQRRIANALGGFDGREDRTL